MYALAGTPTPGTYPVTYPYADTNAVDLTDVTAAPTATAATSSAMPARAGTARPGSVRPPASARFAKAPTVW
ncbi:hypothetical protein ACFQ51_46805 [Streptomyces kaempferi]